MSLFDVRGHIPLTYMQLLALLTAGEGNHNFVRSYCCLPHWTSRTDRAVACMLNNHWIPVILLRFERSTRSLKIIALVQKKLIGTHRSGSFLRLANSALRGDCAVRLQRTSQRRGYVCWHMDMTTKIRRRVQTRRRNGRGLRGVRRK